MPIGLIFSTFGAGLLTLLSPCVLPVLPFVTASSLKHGKKGPIVLGLEVVTTFAFVSFSLARLGWFLGFSSEQLKIFSGGFFSWRAPLALFKPFTSSDPRLRFAVSAEDFDPRIHFALNCASLSCPPINFYEASKIDKQLDLATRGFINSETTLVGNRVQTSSIFKWYRSDFGEDLQTFLEKYLDEPMRSRIVGQKLHIEFNSYKWRLNSQGNN